MVGAMQTREKCGGGWLGDVRWHLGDSECATDVAVDGRVLPVRDQVCAWWCWDCRHANPTTSGRHTATLGLALWCPAAAGFSLASLAYWYVICTLRKKQLIINRISGHGTSIGHVCPFVSTLSFEPIDLWPWFFCMCMGHDHSSHEIDNQGHRSLSKVRIRVTKEDNVVSLSSSQFS